MDAFEAITTDRGATILQGVVSEGRLEVRQGDQNLNLQELNGRAVVVVALPDDGDEGVDAQYGVVIDATSGTYTITVDIAGGSSATTAALAFGATAAAVATAIKALANVGNADVTVTGDPGDYTVAFTGALASTHIYLSVTSVDLAGGTGPELTTIDEGWPPTDEGRYRAALAELTEVPMA